jgi:hypothetical protein
MDAGLAALIGAIVGGIAAIAGSFIVGLTQVRTEKQKWLRSKQDEAAAQLRLQIAEVARKLLSAQHSMEWIAWYAHYAPQRVTQEMVSNYEQEIHKAFPELLGALAVTAALSLDAYNRLTPLAEEVYDLDASISMALVNFKVSPLESAKGVSEALPKTGELYKRLPLRIAEILKVVEVSTR